LGGLERVRLDLEALCRAERPDQLGGQSYLFRNRRDKELEKLNKTHALRSLPGLCKRGPRGSVARDRVAPPALEGDVLDSPWASSSRSRAKRASWAVRPPRSPRARRRV